MARVKKIPQRMCTGCHEMKNKRDLIRIVRTPETEILLDPTGKKAGRGAYICPSLECLKSARKSRRLEKALGQEIPAMVFEALEKELMKD